MIVYLCCLFAMKKTVTLFYLRFSLVMATQKNVDSRDYKFCDVDDVKLRT